MRIFVTHNPEDRAAYFARALDELEQLDGVDVVLNPLDRDLSDAELLDASDGAHVIIAHRSTPGSAELFSAHRDLVAFLRCAVDISTIHVEAASDAGVLVARADKSFVPSTAELALGLLLDLWRSIASSTHEYRQGIEPSQRAGRQLRDATAGIIGLGAIGSYLAEMLHALGMRVIAHDTDAEVAAGNAEMLSLREVLTQADVVFPLAPAEPSTHHLIDADALNAMKPTAVLVNVSRGELVDEAAVAAALESGAIAGFACDVGSAPDQRPLPSLASRPDVVATPHLGGLTPENADAQARSAVDQVAQMLRGEMPVRTVNPDHATRLRNWWSEQ